MKGIRSKNDKGVSHWLTPSLKVRDFDAGLLDILYRVASRFVVHCQNDIKNGCTAN